MTEGDEIIEPNDTYLLIIAIILFILLAFKI